MDPALTFLFPVYNEGKNVENVFKALEKHLLPTIPARILVIYDFDEDNTIPFLRKMQESFSWPIEIIKNTYGPGVLNAIKFGFDQIKGGYVFVSMADASDDYRVVPRAYELARQGYDIICPSRYMRKGKLHGGPFLKQLLSKWGGITLHFFSGVPTHDMTNSFRLYNKKIIEAFPVESDGGFEFGMELTIKAHFAGYRVIEIPAHWWDRAEGKSKFHLMKWLPKYFRWYLFAIRKRFPG